MTGSPNLTDVLLRKMKPPETGRTEHYDGRLPGLGVRVSAQGTKTFFVLYREGRAFRRMSLGRYPLLSLAEARKKAQEALRKAADGEDPQAGRRAARQAPSDRFKDVVTTFLEMHCGRYNRASTAKETERLLRNKFEPHLGDLSVGEIRKADILSILDRIEASGTQSEARHAFAALRKFFNWCVERGLIEQSPCLAIRTPSKPSSRDNVVPDDQLRDIFRAAVVQGWPYGTIVQLLALTAQRRGEVVGMRWEELDLDKGLWNMPGERTKNHRGHTVPLTPRLVAIIRSLPQIDDSPFVFPARGKPDQPYSGYSKGKRMLDAACGHHGWTLHDLRRTAATGMAGAGIAPHVVERVLNHTSGTFGGVAGIYNRFGYLDEMRQALEAWEARLIAAGILG